MIDSLTAKIKRYPFQTGIIVGFIICLLFVGFVNLFQDNGRTLSGNAEIIQEDYLRMTIMEFGQTRDGKLAGWRYAHLGPKADETLRLMRADESISPQILAAFAEAIGKTNVLTGNTSGTGSSGTGTPSSPRKGLSGFGKALLIILLLVVICAAGLYVASLIKTRQKQKRRAEFAKKIEDEPLNVVSPERKPETTEKVPDTLFDLDGLFPKEEKSAPEEKSTADKKPDPVEEETEIFGEEEETVPAEPEKFEPFPGRESLKKPKFVIPEDGSKTTGDEEPEEEPESEEEVSGPAEDKAGETEEPAPEAESEPESESESEKITEPEAEPDPENEADDEPEPEDLPAEEDEPEQAPAEEDAAEPKLLLDFGTEKIEIGEKMDDILFGEGTEPDLSEEKGGEKDHGAEKPLVETDAAGDPDSEDELLKLIRAPKPAPDEPEAEEPAGTDENTEEESADPGEKTEIPVSAKMAEPVSDDDESEEENLIHYQSTYKIGNDMYDEVFSIDQGDLFRGECGISIGETLNNTEPKAVTAFELWLFDKDDIHTATWYLMSDFALQNEGISSRLAQRGNCERIRKGASYFLETATLIVEVKILELEYGNEMEEKNSYFTNVTFDVTARGKQSDTIEE